MLSLSINPNPFNLQTRFRMMFAAITLSFNLFCGLPINYEKNVIYITFFTLLTYFTIYSAIFLQPMCCIKTSGVSSLQIGFTYVSICFNVTPVKGSNSVLYLFNYELNPFGQIPLIILVPIIYVILPNFMALLSFGRYRYNKRCCVLHMVM